METIRKARLALSSLGMYRPLLKDPMVAAFIRVLDAVHGSSAENFFDAYGEFIQTLSPVRGEAEVLDFSGRLRTLIHQNDSLFARQAVAGKLTDKVQKIAANDLMALSLAAAVSTADIKKAACSSLGEEIAELIKTLPDFTGGGVFDLTSMKDFHAKHGCGIYASYGAFQWQRGASGDSSLFGVASPDPVRLSQLKGYEYERRMVLDNTEDFLNGISANNLLLYGDRGTGKSSTVKAVFNEYRGRGLRIIEVSKDSIVEFSHIIDRIASVPLKFIIFIDDLSFNEDDDNYSALKAVLEGGVSARPNNTVIYATSNRRHFVKENFSERDSDDVHGGDAVQEKLSLADRFGITVTFVSPDQNLYFKIVRSLATDRGIQVDPAQLERGAAQWALRFNGRSPRTATQYIDWVSGRIEKGMSITDF